MIQIAICEDEANIRAYLSSLIRAQPCPCEIVEYASAGEYLADTREIDLLFLDIELAPDHSGPDGMELARQIRERAESAPENSVAEELKRDLEEVANFKGSRLEQWLLIYCKQNRLPYHRLTEEEKQWLIRIGSKSEFMKSHISRRGKK